jgi:flavin-dependent dehydrogenase
MTVRKGKIAIAGAGISGAYLNSRLRARGQKAELYDTPNHTRCELTPCAWGTSRGFHELLKGVALEPERYILRRFDHILMDGVRIEADLMTFDKPALLRDLLKGAVIKTSALHPEEYNRVIDATGVSRAFLPAIPEDIILTCMQCFVETDKRLENRIMLGGIGYAWCFPLSERQYHIGCGSLLQDPHKTLGALGWLDDDSLQDEQRVVCACSGSVRLTGPHFSLPFVVEGTAEGIWGVGEAIGCVAPLAGDGVVTGMQSASILVDHWDDPKGYTDALLDKFRWMRPERKVIDKLISGLKLTLDDARVLRRNSKRMGMKVGLKQAMQLMRNLR